MAPRIDVTKYPDALKAMYGLERIARERGIERTLLHLNSSRRSGVCRGDASTYIRRHGCLGGPVR